MKNAGSFGKLLSSVLSTFGEKTVSGEPPTESDTQKSVLETKMGNDVKTSFVTRRTTHFCPSCGWCDKIECTLERKEYVSTFTGEKEVNFYHIKLDKPAECPKCKGRTALPLTQGNVITAVEYLLRALQ
jgi:hypothetical protein